MGESVVINPSGGDPSGDLHPSSQTVVSSEGGDSPGVVSKRSRIYVCQFCGRVCRNAQALGGHMNVHRRERALAKQLLELRNQGDNLKEMSAATAGIAGVAGVAAVAGIAGIAAVAAAAASGNPPAGKGEQEHQEVTIHGGSSSSSSSPPSPNSIAIASAPMHHWRVLHRLPSKKCKRLEDVDLELRLGFTPGRFL